MPLLFSQIRSWWEALCCCFYILRVTLTWCCFTWGNSLPLYHPFPEDQPMWTLSQDHHVPQVLQNELTPCHFHQTLHFSALVIFAKSYGSEWILIQTDEWLVNHLNPQKTSICNKMVLGSMKSLICGVSPSIKKGMRNKFISGEVTWWGGQLFLGGLHWSPLQFALLDDHRFFPSNSFHVVATLCLFAEVPLE